MIAVVREINRPRYPTVPMRLLAEDATVTLWNNKVMLLPDKDISRKGEIVRESFAIKEEDVATKVLEVVNDQGECIDLAAAERIKWAAQLDVKPFEGGKIEYLFYAGCFGAFDARSRRVSMAISRILNAFGKYQDF